MYDGPDFDADGFCDLGDLDDELEDIDEVDNIRAFKQKTMYNDDFDKPSDTE